VAAEDQIPFGKKVGLGTIIIGCAIMAFSVLTGAATLTENEVFTVIGTVVLIAGLAVGLAIAFAAMIKYNKGII
jgi:hypothetical protein